MEELTKVIIIELLKTDIEELEELKKTWIAASRMQGVSENVVHLCETVLELVIEKKQKRGEIA